MRDFDPTAGEFISSGFLSRSRPGGALYDIGSIVGSVAGPLLGGFLGSDASSDASNAQSQSAAAANALQKEQFDLTRADNAGTQRRGDAAGNRLSLMMGLDTGGPTRDQIRSSLLGKYTRPGTPASATGLGDTGILRLLNRGTENQSYQFMPQDPGTPSTIDEAGLNAAIDAEMAGYVQQGRNDPAYGSLTRKFTGADLQNEPGYQFGMKQGTQAVDRSAASRGGLYSGATMKALSRFGQDYAGTKYGEAFNRDQAQKTMAYNQLAGISGTGQMATNQVNAAGQNYATQAGQNVIGAGNAAASGYVGSANAWNSAIGQGIGNYQQQNMLTSLMGGGRSAFAPAVVDDGYSVGLGSAYGGNRRGF